jgi:hypothetical protein
MFKRSVSQLQSNWPVIDTRNPAISSRALQTSNSLLVLKLIDIGCKHSLPYLPNKISTNSFLMILLELSVVLEKKSEAQIFERVKVESKKPVDNNFLATNPATNVPAAMPPTVDKMLPASNLPIPDNLRLLYEVLRRVVFLLRAILFYI